MFVGLRVGRVRGDCGWIVYVFFGFDVCSVVDVFFGCCRVGWSLIFAAMVWKLIRF